MNEDRETVADIVAEMRESMKRVGCHFNEAVESWADRIEQAHRREAIPTPEQWTEIARQGSELADVRSEILRLCEQLQIARDDYVAERNANKNLCRENARLRKALKMVLEVKFFGCTRGEEVVFMRCPAAQAIREAQAIMKEVNNENA